MITITNQEFEQISTFIKKNYGIELKSDKQSLITGRLFQVLQDNGFQNFTDYFQYVQSDQSGEAVKVLLNKITTNHTFFMREAIHFDYFREKVLPQQFQTIRDRDLRVWSAGCSSGEEPYTLAMIMHEFLGPNKLSWDTKILATDISDHVLEIGRKGLYSADQIKQLPVFWKQKYFTPSKDNQIAIARHIKEDVLFRNFNLMNEKFPFKRPFHVIFCRNVMIYFDTETRNRLIQKFYDILVPGGYLFIGHSETIDREKVKFKYIMPAVYRKEL